MSPYQNKEEKKMKKQLFALLIVMVTGAYVVASSANKFIPKTGTASCSTICKNNGYKYTYGITPSGLYCNCYN